METSDRGVLEIMEMEGVVPTVYYDSTGLETYGVGHTAGAGSPNPANMSKAWPTDVNAAIKLAMAQFRRDLKIYEARVNRHVKMPIAQHKYDALIGFDFNTGGVYYRTKSGKMANAKLVTAINRGDPNASDHFFGWVKPPELRKRRTMEKHLFDTGDYDANGDQIPVWRTDGRGKLIGRYSVLDGQTALAMLGRTMPARPSTPAPTAPGSATRTSVIAAAFTALGALAAYLLDLF
jgi:lysozyme